jgi:hypothetical protein
MANKIREIEGVLNAGGRANKYRVSFAWPTGVQGNTNLAAVDILAKSALAPDKTIGTIDLWNQGRKLVIPGDTAFSNSWALDFYLSENHEIRIDMLKWLEACDNFHKNLHTGLPTAVMADVKVEQLDSAAKVVATYVLHGCFPQTVGEVTYGDETSDTIVEFNVAFAFTDWTIGEGEFNNFTPIQPTKNPTAL